MPTKKRNLEKVEAVANASSSHAPTPEESTEFVSYCQRLVLKREANPHTSGEPRPTNEPKSEARRELEAYIETVADRLRGARPRAALDVEHSARSDAEAKELKLEETAEAMLEAIRNRFRVKV